MNTVNLLPSYRMHASRRRRTMMAWAAVISGYTAILTCACAALNATVVIDRGSSRRLAELENELQAKKAVIRSIGVSNRRMVALLDASTLASDHPDWSIVLSVLAAARADGLKLDHVSMAPTAGRLHGALFRVTGVGASRADITDYISGLEAQGLFDSVVAVETRAREAGGLREYSFELSCEIGSGREASAEKKP